MPSEVTSGDALVLAFDTSAAHCAAALLQGDTLLADRLEPMTRGQAERLMPLLEEILAEAGVGWADLSALGVGIGPGNFTGIRISVSAARGLALGLDIPAVGISSLEAQAFGHAGSVISALDGRRGALYLQSFGTLEDIGPLLTRAEALAALLPKAGAPICIGHMAQDIAALCGGTVGEAQTSCAEAIARLTLARMHNITHPAPAPLYLRDADAAPSRIAPPTLIDG